MAREETAPAPASSRPPAGHRRVVLHCDADAFFCQVERQLHPELYGSVTALAVFQHGDVIAADAGAKKLGVNKRDSPADARRALVPRGGALAHVHVTEGHRVSYRPYDKASKAMHRVLRSREMKDTLLRVCGFRNADVRERAEERAERATRDASSAESPLRSPSKARRGVVVEKASIDEAYVQLPSGCSLGAHAAACAHAVRRVVKQKTGLVLSVGAARNKTLAKFASAAAKPDGVKVVTEDDELGAAGSSRNREIRVGVGVGVDTIDTKPERGSSVFISEPSLYV
jgi:nucleotidyltransferase/DNA polymerase involved in DNA repair